MPGRAFLVSVGGVLALAVLGGAGAYGYHELSPAPKKAAAVKPSPSQPAPTTSQRPDPRPAKPGIGDEKADPKPLGAKEVFPSRTLQLNGREFRRSKVALNERCRLAARGRFARALVDGECRRVVRATFVDSQEKFAVTSGIAVMPTSEAAQRTQNVAATGSAGWFRGMPAPKVKKFNACGFATAATRGRYILFACASYLDGQPHKAGDLVLQALGDQFRDYITRPITRRARG